MVNCSSKTFQVYHTMYSAMFVIVLLTWLGLLVSFRQHFKIGIGIATR